MSRPTRRRPALPQLEELSPRITPVLTALFANGTLTVTGDGDNDSAALTANAGGDILLNGGPIAGSPTLGNTLAILMQGGGGNDVLDVSALPGTSRTVILDGEAGDDSLIGGLGADSLTGGDGTSTPFAGTSGTTSSSAGSATTCSTAGMATTSSAATRGRTRLPAGLGTMCSMGPPMPTRPPTCWPRPATPT